MHYYKSYPIHVSAIPAETAQIEVGRTSGLSLESKTSTRELKCAETGDVIFLESTEETRELAVMQSVD